MIALRGFLIGLSVAMPVGPIGVLCIRRSLDWGRASGLATGLGAATADGFYGGVAAFGLGAIADPLIRHAKLTNVAAAIALIGMAALLILRRRATAAAGEVRPAPSLATTYAGTVALTLANPLTIASFAAIITGLGAPKTIRSAGVLTAAVFCGSAAWWLFLSTVTSKFAEQVRKHSRTLDVLAAAALVGFAARAANRAF